MLASRPVGLLHRTRTPFLTVPWGTREPTGSNPCERFWTCGPLLSRCETSEQVSWVKEELPSFMAGSVRICVYVVERITTLWSFWINLSQGQGFLMFPHDMGCPIGSRPANGSLDQRECWRGRCAATPALPLVEQGAALQVRREQRKTQKALFAGLA